MKFAAALLVLAAGCESAGGTTTPLAEPVVEIKAGEFRQEASGVEFPERVGGFRRGAITRYDVDGLNLGAAYAPSRNKVVPVYAAVYVYPAPRFVAIGSDAQAVKAMKANLEAQEWKGSIAEVLRVHADATVVADEEVEVVNAGRTYRGRKATLLYVDDFGGSRIKARSYLYQFCWAGEDWIVKYRFTHPAWFGTGPGVEDLLQGIRWP